ncbi:MAG TPA: TraB/GumN family protein [Myxococcota bacterium]|nr:TraB/GumN family protein [Myxococcota bacterium]
MSGSLRLLRTAANIAPLALALACASLPAPPDARDDGYRYVDRSLGIALELPPGWQGYTSADELPPALAGAIPRGFGPKPALIGMDASGTALVRVLTEPVFRTDARSYFERLVEATADQVEILAASYARDADTVRWRFRAGRPGARFSFVETITVRRSHAIRVAFWTGSPLFSAYADEFERIAAGALLHGETGWEAPWRELAASLDGAAFPALELAEDDRDPIPSCAGAPHGLLWVVESGAGKTFLFPSIHAGHPHQYPLPAPVEQAFLESTRLVVEVDVRSKESSEVIAAAARRGAGEPPTAEQRERAESWLAARGIPFTPFAGQPAWMLSVGLELFQWQMEGFMPRYGVEQHFLERAGARRIVELETAAEQVDVLERIGSDGLDHTLASLDGMSEQIQAVYAAWYCGDEASVARAAAQADSSMPPALQEAVFTSRNETMAERLVPLLDDPGVTFVPVGLGHFLGPRGLPALLEQRGYAVRSR